MRPIKFRMWNKFTNEYWKAGFWLLVDLGGVRVHADTEDGPDEVNPEDFVLEQFTGLHDKTGREIYEGDIIQVFPLRISGEERGTFCLPVVYDQFSASFGMRAGNGLRPLWHDFPSHLEIVGNIHENPELLR